MAKSQPSDVRPLTRDVYQSLLNDEWPSSAGATDFGLKSERHYAALQWAVKNDGVTAQQLDRALGDGKAITALISLRNPYRGIRFETDWQGIQREPKWEMEP